MALWSCSQGLPQGANGILCNRGFVQAPAPRAHVGSEHSVRVPCLGEQFAPLENDVVLDGLESDAKVLQLLAQA